MQPPTVSPREALTTDQVLYLIRDVPSPIVGAGMELVDQGLNVLEDITGDLAGAQVTRSSYADLHATCDFAVSRELDWGAAIVRPYYTLSDGVITARFNLGAYYTSTPADNAKEDVPTFDVQGYDILLGLRNPVGSSLSITAGTSYLTAIEDILTERGYSAYLIDQTAAASVLLTDRTWVFDEQTTWLTVVNDLSASIGYAGVWSDWDGRLRCEPYTSPRVRAPEFVYTVDPATSLLDADRSRVRDYFDAPNQWVVYRNNNVDDVTPVEGNGVWTYTNEFSGDTSVAARGRVITKPVPVDAADQAALMVAGQAVIDADMTVPTTFTVPTFHVPLHWHFDVVYLDDPRLGVLGRVLVTQWSLPLLSKELMTQEWTLIR